MNTIQIPPCYRKVSGYGRSATQHNGLVVVHEFVDTQIYSYIYITNERDAFIFQYIYPSINDPLLQFEIRDAVTQQTAWRIISFKNRYVMTRRIQLSCSRETGGSGSNNSNFFTCAYVGLPGFDKSFFKSNFNNVLFDFFNGNGRLVDSKHTTAFAGSRADPSGEFGEIIRGYKNIIGILPGFAV